MNGAEIVIASLISHGVTHVFGYPGGSILPVCDLLPGSGITHIVPCHEQFACHAADGYARATGKTGVVIATSGPGATNLVTGIANAYMDSVPLVAITGNVKLSLLGHDAFQETDIAGVTMPITKHNFIVKSVDELAHIMCRAFAIAQSGRKGPVLVDIPTDIFTCDTENTYVMPMPLKKTAVDYDEVKKAADAINASSFPFICAGGGVIASGNNAELIKLAHKLNCPAAVTAMGKGAYPASDNLYAGVVGMKLCESARKALRKCDLFIAVGARFSERLLNNVASYAPDARILHLDIDAAETGKNTGYFSRVVGDVAETLCLLTPLVEPKPYKGYVGGLVPDDDFYGIVWKNSEGCIVSTEVGLHQIGAVNGIGTETPRTFITSGGLGAMGFGLPAAIGASFATGKRVVNIAGDGSFNMNIQELMTAAKYNVPVTQIVFKNNSLGMIEKWQNEQYGGRVCFTDLPRTDYIAVAKGMGVDGISVSSLEELEKAMKYASSSDGPYLIVWEENE